MGCDVKGFSDVCRVIYSARISRNGVLYTAETIEATERSKLCPRCNPLRPCGAWCALFGEPVEVKAFDGELSHTIVELCDGKKVSIKNFIDERE